MSSSTRLAPKAHTIKAWEFVSNNPGCSQLSAAMAAKGNDPLDHGMRAVLQAVRENLIRVNFTGARNRLWPTGIVWTKMARDLCVGDWIKDLDNEGSQVAKVERVSRMDDSRAYLILSNEAGHVPWVVSYDLRHRIEIG